MRSQAAAMKAGILGLADARPEIVPFRLAALTPPRCRRFMMIYVTFRETGTGSVQLFM